MNIKIHQLQGKIQPTYRDAVCSDGMRVHGGERLARDLRSSELRDILAELGAFQPLAHLVSAPLVRKLKRRQFTFQIL